MADVNTRRQPRYQAAALSTLEIAPVGSRSLQTVSLLDINQAGGMGLFIPSRGLFDQLALATFLGPWTVLRHTRAGTVSFEVRLFNAIPRYYDGKQGVRVSALPSAHASGDAGTRFFFGMRRKSKRNTQKQIKVRLQKGAINLASQVLNIGDDDGVGLELEASTMVKVTWGEIFSEGWQVTAMGRSLPCFLQRLAHHDAGVVVGAVAPGITRGGWHAESESAPVGGAGDEQLLDLLNSVLKQKPSKRK